MTARKHPPGEAMTVEAFRALESESTFQSWAIDEGRKHGWLVTHFRPLQTPSGWRTALQGDSGFVDAVYARGGEVLLAEFKTDKRGSRLSRSQEAWRLALTPRLEGAQHEYYVWRPRDRAAITARLAA